LEERYAELRRFETVAELVEWGQFDASIVCLPNNVGPDVITTLATAGKHVLAEKPVAGTAADFRPVAEAVERSQVVFQHGFLWRYDVLANRVRRMIAEGRFGKLISVEMTYVTSDVRCRTPSFYLFDGAISKAGFFNWLGCHYLDLLLHVTRSRVTAVTARTGVFGDVSVDVDDGGVAIFDLENGALANFVGGYWLPRWAGECHWTLRGSQRWVHWDPTRAGTSGSLEIHGPKPQWYATEETFSLPADHTIGYGGANGVALVHDWIRAIGGERQAAHAALRSSLATLELLDAVYESSRRGQRVDCSIGH
jgi:predicted dehydrogenase